MSRTQAFIQKIKNKQHILKFIPEDLEYITKVKKIKGSDGKFLKTDYLCDLMNTFIVNYHFNGHSTLNLWTDIIKPKYGCFYKSYIRFLEEVGFIDMISDYFVGKKAKTYALVKNVARGRCTRVKCSDTVLMKKWKEFKLLHIDQDTLQEKDIDWVRKSLIEDLHFVELNFEGALKSLNNAYDIGIMRLAQYKKNMLSIESIKDETLFWSFDRFGRMHTNFTVLKKTIRNRYLTINGEGICELDIPNAQPLFLALVLKKSNFLHLEELEKFVNAVRQGLFYEDFVNIGNISRSEAKELIFRVFFGRSTYCWQNNIFRKVYPNIFKWIRDYKNLKNDYRALSWELQRIESDLMFKSIISEVKTYYPDSILFTVHDSVYFQKSMKNLIEPIFTKHVENLWKSQFNQELIWA